MISSFVIRLCAFSSAWRKICLPQESKGVLLEESPCWRTAMTWLTKRASAARRARLTKRKRKDRGRLPTFSELAMCTVSSGWQGYAIVAQSYTKQTPRWASPVFSSIFFWGKKNECGRGLLREKKWWWSVFSGVARGERTERNRALLRPQFHP